MTYRIEKSPYSAEQWELERGGFESEWAAKEALVVLLTGSKEARKLRYRIVKEHSQ